MVGLGSTAAAASAAAPPPQASCCLPVCCLGQSALQHTLRHTRTCSTKPIWRFTRFVMRAPLNMTCGCCGTEREQK